MELKYFSTFSGIGGFELGIDNKAECIGFSEINKYATEIYKKHFPGHKNYGDITTINASELPNFDLLVGGFPCQSFSIAGKRKGFEDTRGTLFFDLARILQAKQPGLFIFENVKGLLSHNGGQTFKTIIATLTELGYDLQWQVLNSKNHGVPQNRERVFIVGHLGGFGGRQVFPIIGSNNEINGNRESQISGTIIALYGKHPTDRTYVSNEAQIRRLTPMPPVILRGRPKMPYENGKRKLEYKTYDKIVPTISTNCGSGDQKNMVVQAIKYGQNNSDRNGNISDDMFTLKAGGSNAGITDGIKIRRLTPTECERLQAFPDGWTEEISDSQRYKCLGNAVTVNVVSEIIKNILYE